MTELVFLPGWAHRPSVWIKQQVFAKRYRCHFIDLEDYWHKQKIYNITPGRSLLAEALAALLDDLQNPVLIGWSMGSLLALEISLKMRQKLKGLILVGATARFTTDVDYAGGLPPIIVKRMQRQLEADINKTLTKFYSLIFTDAEKEAGFSRQLVDIYNRNNANFSTDFLQAGLEYLLKTDLREDLAKSSCGWPAILIIHGSDDNICPFKGGITLAKLLTKVADEVNLIELPKAGHACFFTSAEVFNETVEKYLVKLGD
ncbi:MAG: alpha/beta fold hydrolase [Desulfotomaculum sp.]|nr:alpha/beta fold hydrolase [Desulfotomaculum sp.]